MINSLILIDPSLARATHTMHTSSGHNPPIQSPNLSDNNTPLLSSPTVVYTDGTAIV